MKKGDEDPIVKDEEKGTCETARFSTLFLRIQLVLDAMESKTKTEA